MTSLTFEHNVLLEQVRCIESSQGLDDDAPSFNYRAATGDSATELSGEPFENRLLHRARQLRKEHELEDDLSHAAGLFRVSNFAAMFLAALLGAVATLTALSGGSTINIYWLLLVLVGFNLLSMILWVAGMVLGLENLTNGLLSKATAWLPRVMSKRDTPRGRADSAWLACHFGGEVGKWRASVITQKLWLIYLAAGLASLLLVLMARQFDFVWGTTLLSDASFINLTSTLSEPLRTIGFATPSTQQVLETRIGAGFPLTGEHRYNWAQFLIGALLVCGLLPRLLLWLTTMFLLNTASRRFAPDYYLPYYVHLRQELLPLHGSSQIVDADTRQSNSVSPGVLDTGISAPGTLAPQGKMVSPLPAHAHWVGVELDEQTNWPTQGLNTQDALGRIVDRASLETILEQLRAQATQDLAIVVSAARTPDRGLKRSIASLENASANTWLVLLLAPEESISESRLSAWYRLAQDCEIPAQNVITQVEASA